MNLNWFRIDSLVFLGYRVVSNQHFPPPIRSRNSHISFLKILGVWICTGFSIDAQYFTLKSQIRSILGPLVLFFASKKSISILFCLSCLNKTDCHAIMQFLHRGIYHSHARYLHQQSYGLDKRNDGGEPIRLLLKSITMSSDVFSTHNFLHVSKNEICLIRTDSKSTYLYERRLISNVLVCIIKDLYRVIQISFSNPWRIAS